MSGRNSTYSPLPQSNSDSEGSSEELHVGQESRVVSRVTKVDNSKSEKTFNGQKSNSINYKLLDADSGLGATLIKFQSTTDEVSILKPNPKTEVFSRTRKICFVLSLLLCVLTTVIFIWFLPCNEGTCFSLSSKHNLQWDQTLTGLEVYGPISIVTNASDSAQCLVFLTRNLLGVPGKKSGMIAFNGVTGMKLWNNTINREPTDIDCSLLDMNLDGVSDCLVYGNNFLKAVDAATGLELWEIYNEHIPPTKILDFPLVIYDVNDDGVRDLLTSTSFDHHSGQPGADQNYLYIISGKTGIKVDMPVQNTLCADIHNLMFENSSTISYTCHKRTGEESLETISLEKLLSKLPTSFAEKLHLNETWTIIPQHQVEMNSIPVDGRRLIVNNVGNCPEDCSVSVDIKIEENPRVTLYSYRDRNTYCMIPTVMTSDGAHNIVLKFWKWQSKGTFNDDSFSVQRMMAAKEAKTTVYTDGDENDEESKMLDSEMLSEGTETNPRDKRGEVRLRRDSIPGISSPPYHHVIRETIISLNLGGNKTVNNVTGDKIIQICRKNQGCQPDVFNQRRSLMLADLNGDGKEEMVSFSSKYAHETEEDSDGDEGGDERSLWQMETTIRVMTLL